VWRRLDTGGNDVLVDDRIERLDLHDHEHDRRRDERAR
jgi:hypothetical protein